MNSREMQFSVLLLSVVVVISLVDGSRILIAAPYGTKSHQNVYIPLAQELVRRGHHITIISNYLNDEIATLENVRQVWIEKLVIDMSQFPNLFAPKEDLSTRLRKSYEIFKAMFNFQNMIAEATYEDPQVQQLMATETFDLVMFSESCGMTCYPFGWHFKVPAIAISPNVMYPGRAELLGDDEHYSYVPFLLTSFSDKMNLSQRTINFIVSKIFQYVSHDLPIRTVESMFKRLTNPACPPLLELEKNISLVLTNTHPSFSYPRVLPPQVIEVGGLHCRPANPLPDDLENFVSSSAEAGFILFGVGTVVNMDDVPEEIIQSFIKAFSLLPQRVVWQWKGKTRSDLPKNVLALPWLPQQDLLGHSNCRAFITHGGLNSLQEAIYHGIPVLGMPFGTDQIANVERALKEGYAIRLDWKDVTQEALTKALQNLLHNSSFKVAAGAISSFFRNQIQPPLERAVFWTEYVMRHNGTDHMRLGSVDLLSYQRNLIDVYVVLALSAAIPLFITYYCVRKCCCRRKINVEKKRQ